MKEGSVFMTFPLLSLETKTMEGKAKVVAVLAELLNEQVDIVTSGKVVSLTFRMDVSSYIPDEIGMCQELFEMFMDNLKLLLERKVEDKILAPFRKIVEEILHQNT